MDFNISNLKKLFALFLVLTAGVCAVIELRDEKGAAMLGRPLPLAISHWLLALRVRGVIGGHLEAPQILLHGLLAARLVLLGLESSLILSHLGEILRTVCYCGRNGCETSPTCAFLGIRHRRTFVTVGVE